MTDTTTPHPPDPHEVEMKTHRRPANLDPRFRAVCTCGDTSAITDIETAREWRTAHHAATRPKGKTA